MDKERPQRGLTIREEEGITRVIFLEAYTIRLERGSEDWWVASIDEWPGVLTQGKTVAGTLVNLADAVRLSVAAELEGRWIG